MLPKTASASRSCCRSWPAPAAEPPPVRRVRRFNWRRKSAIRWWSVRPTCWAVVRWKSFMKGDLERYMREAVKVSNDSPVLLDRFLNDAIEVDVDAICDGEDAFIGGIMEHIEQAGMHFRRLRLFAAAVLAVAGAAGRNPPPDLAMAKALNVVGLMNVQFAIQNGDVYVLEVNPRASRTVPFVSKATVCRWPRSPRAAWPRFSLDNSGVKAKWFPPFYSVKRSRLPVHQVPRRRYHPRPEMKSTGEVMGVGPPLAKRSSSRSSAASAKLPKFPARSSSASSRRIRQNRRGRSRAYLVAARLWPVCDQGYGSGHCRAAGIPGNGGEQRSTKAGRISSTRSRTATSRW